mmetsp:Transcript_22474/g.32603  ORF Transcript_22474/g.32603 Transcript_22474/m.32603 type:complete len:200 (-) Transcript_22474:338-937(-)
MCYAFCGFMPRTSTITIVDTSKVKLTANTRIRSTSVWHIIRIKRHDMCKDVVVSCVIVGLSPVKFKVLSLGQLFLDSIMHTLYKHPLKAIVFENISHGGTVTKGINGPCKLGNDVIAKGLTEPIMSFLKLYFDGIALRVGLVRLYPAASDKFKLSVVDDLRHGLLHVFGLLPPPPFEVADLRPNEFASFVLLERVVDGV